jgi:hypothetical protein
VVIFDSISSIAVGLKLIRQADVVDCERVEWFGGLTSEFAGVFEGNFLQKSPDYFSLTLEAKETELLLVGGQAPVCDDPLETQLQYPRIWRFSASDTGLLSFRFDRVANGFIQALGCTDFDGDVLLHDQPRFSFPKSSNIRPQSAVA